MHDDRFRGLIKLQQKIRDANSDLQAIMEAVVSEYSVMPQANGVVVELRDADQVYYAAASGTSEGLIGLRLPINASLSGLSILTSQPLYCKDSEVDPRVNRVACRRVNLRSMIVVPIPHRGQIVGVLKYYSADEDAFSEDDMMLAHLLIGPLAVGFSGVAEADAERVSEELRQLIQIKQQFVATVTHELRTPLTSIVGSLSLLVNGVGGEVPPRAASILGIAHRNADRLKRLVDDLLTFEKLDANALSFDIEQMDLGSVIATAVEEAEPFASTAKVRLKLERGADRLFALGDGLRMHQAVTNLISNAVKFSPEGGEVIVNLSRTSGHGLIRVQDEGPGVSESFRKRLFQPYAQDDQLRAVTNLPSTGLGLSITKSIIEQMGGGVRLVKCAQKGAVFEIALPLSAGSSDLVKSLEKRAAC